VLPPAALETCGRACAVGWTSATRGGPELAPSRRAPVILA